MATDQYSVLGKAPGSDELKKLSQDDVYLTIKNLVLDMERWRSCMTLIYL